MRDYLTAVRKLSTDALKRKDKTDRAFWSLVISNGQNIAKSLRQEVTDANVLEALLQIKKMLNGLVDTLVGPALRDTSDNPLVIESLRQIRMIESLLPDYMDETAIWNALDTLPSSAKNKKDIINMLDAYADENDYLVDKRMAMEIILDYLRQ
jgi:hypothetical protein